MSLKNKFVIAASGALIAGLYLDLGIKGYKMIKYRDQPEVMHTQEAQRMQKLLDQDTIQPLNNALNKN